ncbi:MAG: aminoglycoside phosphotransferase family protein [Pseudomonadota bacterium]
MADPSPSAKLLEYLNAEPLGLLAETGIARVWRVRASGRETALKEFKDGNERNEARAPELLMHWQSAAAVEVIDHGPGWLLMAYLPGPALGDLTRRGEDEKASEVLARMAQRLHRAPGPTPPALPRLADWFQALFQLDLARLDRSIAEHFGRAVEVAQTLLANEATPQLLHGDLHHDNILWSGSDWRVVDPKGVLGPAGFELANAMRNPSGAEDLAARREVIARRAAVFSDALDVTETEFLGWAAAKCALSLAWQMEDGAPAAADLQLLPKLLAAAGEMG